MYFYVFSMVFDFTQFWLDGQPGNDYFWNSHKNSDHLTPLTSLGLHPQWFETDCSNSSQSEKVCLYLIQGFLIGEADGFFYCKKNRHLKIHIIFAYVYNSWSYLHIIEILGTSALNCPSFLHYVKVLFTYDCITQNPLSYLYE